MDIPCSEWDIFLKFFVDIPGMFIHYFQIFENFLFPCESASWLTSLLKLYLYRNISCTGWDIFLNILEDIPGVLVHYFHIITNFFYVCQSISLVLSNFGSLRFSFWDLWSCWYNNCSYECICINVCQLVQNLIAVLKATFFLMS